LIHFLCIHGNFGTPNDWQQLCAALTESFSGASFDRPDLWALSSTDAIDELARLVAVAEGNGKHVFLLGYSLGARLALELLARKDITPAGAVLCSVNPGLADPAARRDRLNSDTRWAERVGDLQVPWRQIVDEWNSQAVFEGSKCTPSLTFTSPNEERIVRSAIARRFREWSLGALMPRWSTLETTKCPVLCLAGERDTKFRLILESIERLPNPRITCGVMPGAGHRLVADSPAAVALRISLFAAKSGAPA